MLTYNFKELDATLGEDLYYYGARYYDAVVGRFGSPDPIRSYLNPYSYANNNPIRYVDVAGMASALVSGQASPKDVSGFSTFLDPLAKEKMISSPRERVMTEEEANLIRRIFGGNESESESEKPLNQKQVEAAETTQQDVNKEREEITIAALERFEAVEDLFIENYSSEGFPFANVDVDLGVAEGNLVAALGMDQLKPGTLGHMLWSRDYCWTYEWGLDSNSLIKHWMDSSLAALYPNKMQFGEWQRPERPPLPSNQFMQTWSTMMLYGY